VTDERWTEQVGDAAPRVTVYERPDRDGEVYLRWYLDGKPKQARAKVGAIRDSRGRIQRRKQDAARSEARQKWEEVQGHRAPRARSGPMTLKQGLDLAFSQRGCYPMDPNDDRWTADAYRLVSEAVALLGGADVLWEDATPGMIRAVWRKLEAKGASWDKATKALTVFFTVAGWLEGEFQGQRFPRPMKKWRGELKEHWHKKGHETERHRPRHNVQEIEALFSHLDRADPRIRLALVLGGELRGGQVIRTMRSDCDLPDAGPWVVDIPSGSPRKPTPTLILNDWEKGQLRTTLEDGYLSDLEVMHRAGTLKDYALFVQGRLRRGKATEKNATRPMNKTSLMHLFHEYERAAGVTPEPGRGWHGLRRGFSDYYAHLIRTGKITDPRILDHLQGWVPGSTMRERIYQDQESEALRQDASAGRMHRPGLHQKEG
jgi:hypothetical protein